jgi:hypothetical protein
VQSDEEEEETEEDITSKFEKMTFKGYESSSLKFEMPFLIYPYKEDKQKKVCIDFIVLPLPRESYRLSFNVTGTQVFLYTQVPKILIDKRRLMTANTSLTEDTSKAVAFEEVADPLTEGNEDSDPIWGPPQVVKLPFPCDTAIPIEHEMQAFESWSIPTKNQGENDI